jgi:uncharacterized repeat protein (TIGR03803 family)
MNPCHRNALTDGRWKDARLKNDRLKKNSFRPAGLFATAVTTFHGALMSGFLCVLLIAATQPAQAQTESVVYDFLFGTGAGPNSTLLMAGDNLYGTTRGGGRWERGVIFSVNTTTDSETVLHSFNGPAYAHPNGLIWGIGKYVFIGTTPGFGFRPYGTVYAMGHGAKRGHPFRGLYSFNKSQGANGSSPVSPLAIDSAGSIYGVTTFGGSHGGGEIFEITRPGAATILYSFAGGAADGANPYSGLVLDPEGNLYGTTSHGGSGTGCSGGCGVVYKFAPDGTETVLYNFTGGADGADPQASLVLDGAGNLYGTTYQGGGAGCSGVGCGTVFKVTPGGTETVLYSFAGGLDGAQPFPGVILDAAGNLYGTTYDGGGSGCGGDGCGTVFKVTPSGSETILYSFTGGADGGLPMAGLVMDGQGNLFGTASTGGFDGFGVVFEVTP